MDKFYEGPPRCLVYPKLWLTLGDSATGNEVDNDGDVVTGDDNNNGNHDSNSDGNDEANSEDDDCDDDNDDDGSGDGDGGGVGNSDGGATDNNQLKLQKRRWLQLGNGWATASQRQRQG